MKTERFIELRKAIHRQPERSGEEEKTALRIIEELKGCNPDRILTDLGGFGVAVKFSAIQKKKKSILFRAELDAIAVREETGLDYRSGNPGVMHGCGHDGHMTILVALAHQLKKDRPVETDVWLLFQPSEETGEGAQRVLDDPRFDDVKADHAYALHNLPGFPVNRVIVKEEVFAAASTGVEVTFKGRSSHAAYPEQGVNPAVQMADLIQFADQEFDEFRNLSSINKIVTTYTQLGERAFGINPGEGKTGFTIRSSSDDELDRAVQKMKDKVEKLSHNFDGEIGIELVEPFSATVNSSMGVEAVIEAAGRSGLDWQRLEKPFPWSEDFGKFRNKFPITLFGLGTGEDHPPLHSERYDFNDQLIEAGVNLFKHLID